MSDWFLMEPITAVWILLSAIMGICAIIFMSRLFGLRSFSKLSGFDFAITVAFGSVLAGLVMAETPSIVQGGAALLSLFIVQAVFAYLRRKNGHFAELVNNDARLVYRDGEFLEDQMRKAQITRADILAKMREANAITLDDVLAVIVETTGDISVLHQTGDSRTIDPVIMDGVKGWS